MKITGGKFRGRVIRSPVSHKTRPSSEKVRKAIFDILGPRIEGSLFLDLFAGTGAIGIEALSRGASKSIFVEKNFSAAKQIEENLKAFELEKFSVVLKMEAIKGLAYCIRAELSFDVIFMDPPYELFETEKYPEDLLKRIDASSLLSPSGILMIEDRGKITYNKIVEQCSSLEYVRAYSYGETHLHSLRKK